MRVPIDVAVEAFPVAQDAVHERRAQRPIAWVHRGCAFEVVREPPIAEALCTCDVAQHANGELSRGGRGRRLCVTTRRHGAGSTRPGRRWVGSRLPCAAHAVARRADDGNPLDDAATGLAGIGATLLAAEAHAHAALVHRTERRARASRRVAAELAASCPGARTPALPVDERADDLTTRELEVVTLAARGGKSREIAEELVISVRTVDNLLQRAYTKLGVHSRTEAAVALDMLPDRADVSDGSAGRRRRMPVPGP